MSDETTEGQVPEESGPVREFRHESRSLPFELAAGDDQSIAAISDHFEKYIGPVANVFHEIISDLVHIDVHIIAPAPDRPYYVLFTTGMSDRPMTVPTPELAQFRYAELMLYLPPTWKLSQEDLEDERNYWPIRWLKQLARFPHEYQTWLFEDHTIPSSNDMEGFAPDTELCCWWLLAPAGVPEDFYALRLREDKQVFFLQLVPLYRAEMEEKLKGGSERLGRYLQAQRLVPDDLYIINPQRPQSRKPQGFRLWPFGKRN